MNNNDVQWLEIFLLIYLSFYIYVDLFISVYSYVMYNVYIVTSSLVFLV